MACAAWRGQNIEENGVFRRSKGDVIRRELGRHDVAKSVSKISRHQTRAGGRRGGRDRGKNGGGGSGSLAAASVVEQTVSMGVLGVAAISAKQ